MRRTELLFQITQILRSRPTTTAKYLSDRLNISIRTVYRYIDDLTLSGIPIISQTGKGYWLEENFNFPPIRLSEDELLALSLGSRLVKSISDPYLADAAQQLIEKVEAITPKSHQHLLYQTQVHAPSQRIDTNTAERLGKVRMAVGKSQKLQISYRDGKDCLSQRVLWPLALAFWGTTWTVAAWCEERSDFRAFRIDRIIELETLNELYPNQIGRRLSDFIAREKERSAI